MKGDGAGVVVLSAVLALGVVIGVVCAREVLPIWPAGSVGVDSRGEVARDAVEEEVEVVVSAPGSGPTTPTARLDDAVSVSDGVGVEEVVSGRGVAKKVVEEGELVVPRSDKAPTKPTVTLDVVVGWFARSELGEMVAIEMGVTAESSGEDPAVGLCLITGIEVEVVDWDTLGVGSEWDAE
jgi:hypothetical protein